MTTNPKQPVEEINKLKAKMLLKLISEHKQHCNSFDCGISCFLFLDIFENLMGRKANEKEFKVFL